jgi:salicylate hydroxylase
VPGTGRTYYIAGAGISGLTLALALAKFGAKVVVLERGPTISEFGAGLQISPNARKILNNLGLDEVLGSSSLEPDGIDIYPYLRPDPLVTLELGAIMRERFGAPYAVMHRADLADLLYRACRRFANIDILFGVRSWSVESHERGVTISIDEANGQTRTGRGLAFIGADGVHSRTRTEVIGGPRARYGQRVAWRTLLPFDSVAGQLALDRVSVLFAPGSHLVCYPLPHRRQVNLALFAKGAETAFQKYYGQRHARVARVAALSATNGRIFHMRWPLSVARNLAIAAQGRRGHLRRLAWLYGYEAQTEAAPISARIASK